MILSMRVWVFVLVLVIVTQNALISLVHLSPSLN